MIRNSQINTSQADNVKYDNVKPLWEELHLKH